MKILVGSSYNPECQSCYVYRKDEYSIDYCCDQGAPHGGILFNDLSLEIDKDGTALFLSGLCSHTIWETHDLLLPNFSYNQLTVETGFPMEMGVYFKVNELERWAVLCDTRAKTICVGDHLSTGQAICFTPGSIIVLEAEKPVAVWFYNIGGLPVI